MLNKKGVQNSESNYLSNVLWNFKSKNEENGSQTSSNNSSSKNNPVENMDIETIKLNEKDDDRVRIRIRQRSCKKRRKKD